MKRTRISYLILALSVMFLISVSCRLTDIPLQIVRQLIPQRSTKTLIQLSSETPAAGTTSTHTLEPTAAEALMIDYKDTFMHRGNLERTGVYQSPGPKESPSLIWKFKAEDSIYSSPAIFEGVAYFGSHDGNLYAVDITTSEALWVFNTDDRVISSPAISNGAAYFGSDDGNLYAVDITTGEVLWVFNTGDWVSSSPAISDGMVFFGSYDGFLYAVDAQTGEEVWRFEVAGLDDPDSGLHKAVSSSPAISNGVVLFGSNQAGGASKELFFYAVDVKTGQKLWEYPICNSMTSPVVYEGSVYFGGFFNFFGLDIESGSIVMTLFFDTNIISPAAVFDGVVYFGCDFGLLHAVDLRTVTEKWNFYSGSVTPISTAPSVADGVVYFGSNNGLLSALDIQTGQALWEFETGEWITTSPVISAGVLYFGSADGYLYALE